MKHANARDINLFVAWDLDNFSGVLAVDLVPLERSQEAKEIPRQTDFLVLSLSLFFLNCPVTCSFCATAGHFRALFTSLVRSKM